MHASALNLGSSQKEMVRNALRSILDSSQFRKSRRYPAFLEYVVFNSLEGDDYALKERVIATKIFGRQANYDSSSDAVVRVAAGEVRRRLSQYFTEHPDAPVRIDLPVGSYTVEFHFSPKAVDSQSLNEPQDSIGSVPNEAEMADGILEKEAASNKALYYLFAIAMAVILLTIFGVAFWKHQGKTLRMDLWRSVLKNGQPALIVAGKYAVHPPPGVDFQRLNTLDLNMEARSAVSMEDAIVMARVCSFFSEYGHDCNISSAPMETLEGLTGKSVVLLGGLNNDWTLKLLAPLPYHMGFANAALPDTPTNRVIIEHKSDGDAPMWVVHDEADPQTSTDYAIIARFHSDITDGMAVVIAGLHPGATKAAGDFLFSPDERSRLLALAPKDWKGINFEAVLQTEIIKGSPGRSTIAAASFW